MKSKLYIAMSVLAVLCLLCSCGGGGGSADGEAQKTVAVSFAVDTESASRSITVTNPTVANAELTYQYKAKALFSSEFGQPQGDTRIGFGTAQEKEHWVNFINKNTGEVGDFAQGKWQFEVRVIKENRDNEGVSLYDEGDTTTYTLMYQTAEAITPYLNATTTASPIDVTVVRQIDKNDGAKGTLSISSITANTASESDQLVITYGPVGGAQSGTTTIAATSRTGAAPYTTTFTSDYRMDPGLYWVTFAYNDGTANVGASTKFVDIIKNMPTTVSGKIDANKWVATSFTVKGVKGIKEISCEASTEGEVFTKGSPVVITVTADITEKDNTGEKKSTGETIKYYFCDGDHAPALIELTEGEDGDGNKYYYYPWNTTSVAKGNYYISIIASDADGKLAADSAPLKITIK